MRLLPVAQLQAMLQVAQKFVSAAQLVKFRIPDVPFIVQLLQGKQRSPRP